MKIKKLLLPILSSFLLLSTLGCNNNENLEANIIKDQYRTYYEIFVGAYSDSDKNGLGDFKGLYNRLDYLNDGKPNSGNDLGVDGIWLMPIMKANSYHKYDVRDYKSIDSDYGTMEDFDLFIQEANKRGINVIIDLVINHTSHLHSWFKKAKKALQEGDLDNKYINYYSIVTKDNRELGKIYHQIEKTNYYYEGNFSDQMPELNFDNEEVREEIKDIIKFWLDKGVGGFRIDAAKYIYLDNTSKNVAFWKWFMEEVKKVKEDAYVVGEVWSADSLITPYYETLNCFDFGMSQNNGAIANVVKGIDSVNNFVEYINFYRNTIEKINPNAILNPFITNHDMDRAAGFLSVEQRYMHMAANIYMLLSGNPFIYYGEEIGMKGSRGTSNTDANRRLAMLWGDKDTVQDPIGTTYDSSKQINGTVKEQRRDKNSLFKHYQKLIKIRNAHPEIARGKYTPIYFYDQEYFGGYLSTYNNSAVGIFHNVSMYPLTIDLSKYTEYDFKEIKNYSGEKATLDNKILTIPGLTSVILK